MSKETSAEVAKKASWILTEGRQAINEALGTDGLPDDVVETLREYKKAAESCAASALAQREEDPSEVASAETANDKSES